MLEQSGLTLLIEFDPAVNLTNGESVAKLLGMVDSPFVGAIWDPGNDIYDPEGEKPYPNGYNAIKPYIKHIHLKDAVKIDGKVKGVPIGEGEVDYINQFSRLINDGYAGYIVVETHYKKHGEISESLMKNPMGSAFSNGGYEATEECLISLEKVIEEAVQKL